MHSQICTRYWKILKGFDDCLKTARNMFINIAHRLIHLVLLPLVPQVLLLLLQVTKQHFDSMLKLMGELVTPGGQLCINSHKMYSTVTTEARQYHSAIS